MRKTLVHTLILFLFVAAVTVPAQAQEILNFLKQTEEGKNAEIIGEATSEFKGVAMQTAVGGKRIIARPVGDPVPRIC